MTRHILKAITLMSFVVSPALYAAHPDVTAGSGPLQTKAQAVDPFTEQLQFLQTEWARIKYKVTDKAEQIAAMENLTRQAERFTTAFPNKAEPKIWQGIILSSLAGIDKGFSSLSKVKTAKKLFEESIAMNPTALQGSAYTSLGSLYYQVPSWPIAFGDNSKAEKYLKQALKINPKGIDSNYFYGDYLVKTNRYKEAKYFLEKALSATDRPNRAIADSGRREEIKLSLRDVYRRIK